MRAHSGTIADHAADAVEYTASVASALITEHVVSAATLEANKDLFTCMLKLAAIAVTMLAALCTACGFHKCFDQTKIRQYCGIGEFLRLIGYDKFEEFDLTVIVHGIQSSEQVRCFVRVAAGHEKACTKEYMCKSGEAIQETLNIKCAQGSSYVLFEMVEKAKNTFSSDTVLASRKVQIEEVLHFVESGQKEAVVMRRVASGKKRMSADPKVIINMVREMAGDGSSDSDKDAALKGINMKGLSAETQVKLMQAANKRNKEERQADKGSGSEDSDAQRAAPSEPIDQLSILASTCEGPLQMAQNFGGHVRYHFAVWKDWRGSSKGPRPPGSKACLIAWSLGWWKDKALYDLDDPEHHPPEGSIRMLKVCNVYAVASMPNELCIRYQKSTKERTEIFVSRVDRSRDAWVESLHLFIDQLRLARKNMEKAGDGKPQQSESDGSVQDSASHESSAHGHVGHKSLVTTRAHKIRH